MITISSILCSTFFAFVLSQRCDQTFSGPKIGNDCQFPFRFRGKIYRKCTDITDPGKFWCSVKRHDNETHVSGQKEWGYCHPRCHAEQLDATNKPDYIPTASKATCGYSVSSGQLPAGSKTKPGEFPFLALLGYQEKPDKSMTYCCGGALINRRYVITAAHCHNAEEPRAQIKEVVIGEHQLDKDPDCTFCSTAQRFKINPEDVTLHQGWVPSEASSNGNDIALIRLPSPALTIHQDGNQTVLPICLPWLEILTEELFVAGWSKTTNNPICSVNNVLRKLQVDLISTDECKGRHRDYVDIVRDRHICAGGVSRSRTCCDSGGPLIARSNQQDEHDPMYLRGISSFGFDKCGRGHPIVYTDIMPHLPWIRGNMKP